MSIKYTKANCIKCMKPFYMKDSYAKCFNKRWRKKTGDEQITTEDYYKFFCFDCVIETYLRPNIDKNHEDYLDWIDICYKRYDNVEKILIAKLL